MSRWDRMTPEGWRRVQGRKLAQLLQYEVAPYHAYYRSRAKALGIDLARITSVGALQKHKGLITQKSDIIGRDRDFVLQPNPKTLLRHDLPKMVGGLVSAKGSSEEFRHRLEMQYRPVVCTFTTGRSGRRTAFLFTNHDLHGFLAVAAQRLFQMLQVPRDAFAISLFPSPLHLAHVLVVYGAHNVPALVNPLIGMSTEDRMTAIEYVRPTILFGVTSYLERVLTLAAEQRRDFSSVTRVVTGGEGLADTQRNRMREALWNMGSDDPVILSTYGFTEARLAFMECVEGAREGKVVGYHVFPDLTLIETARITENPDGTILSAMSCRPGEEGEILATPLEGHGSIVLRWRTKDLARVSEDPCPACGRRLPRILPPIRRRTSDMLKNVKATLVDFEEVALMFGRNPAIRAWQVLLNTVMNGQDMVSVFLALDNGKQSNSPEVAKIRESFKQTTEVSIDELLVEPYETVIKRLGTDSELKERRIVDLRI